MKGSICILCALALTACSQQHSVVGDIEGLTNDTILRRYAKVSELSNPHAYISDTIYAHKGSFAFDLPNDTAYFVQLRPVQSGEKIEGGTRWNGPVSDITLYVDKNERIKVDGSIDSIFIYYEATGSQINVDNSTLRATLMPLRKQSFDIIYEVNDNTSAEKIQDILTRYKKAVEQERQTVLHFIRMHPDRQLSGLLLSTVPTDSIEVYYNMLTDDAKESMFKPMIEQAFKRAEAERIRREAEKRMTVGNVAPDFTLEKSDGTSFTLSSLHGKYVLLDFWGSWCIWCIKGFPDLKKFYADNKKRLEVVGIACKDKRKDWLAAVEKHQLPWTNVYNPTDAAMAEDLINLYNINGFPTKILLDPEGRIMEICVGEKPEFYDTVKSLYNLR